MKCGWIGVHAIRPTIRDEVREKNASSLELLRCRAGRRRVTYRTLNYHLRNAGHPNAVLIPAAEDEFPERFPTAVAFENIRS